MLKCSLMGLCPIFICFMAIVDLMAKQMAVLCHLDGVWGVAPGRTIYILDLLVRTDTILFFGGSFAPFRGLGVL